MILLRHRTQTVQFGNLARVSLCDVPATTVGNRADTRDGTNRDLRPIGGKSWMVAPSVQTAKRRLPDPNRRPLPYHDPAGRVA
jgi:hypothetical protein